MIYKIITKIILNRIKPFLPRNISPLQVSFIKGRRPSDNAIIIQEIINKFRKSKGAKGSFMLKLDLEEAFDKLEWSFIYRALIYFKFPPKITSIILNCITTSSVAVLVNGIKTDFFQPTRGIRQGDPMSPLHIHFMHGASLQLHKPSGGYSKLDSRYS